MRAPEAKTGQNSFQPLAINPDIVVAITDIKVEGGSDDQTIEVGDYVEVHGTWDASATDPQPGDEFTIGFPDELQLTHTLDFDLVGDDDTVWGTCEVSVPGNVLHCTLSDAVTDRPEDVKGSFYVYSEAVEYTTQETLYFDVNGSTEVPGELPGEGGINDGQVIGDATKSGTLSPDKTAIRWTIDIPGPSLISLDSEDSGEVTLTDTLSPNMKLCEDGRVNAKLFSGRPGSLTEVTDGVELTQAGGAGTPISITITNGEKFDAGQIYRVQYSSCTTSGEVDIPAEGEKIEYSNSIDIGGNAVGTGVGTDWRPHKTPEKWGSISAGSRYKELNWNIRVPGTFIALNDDLETTINETLSDNHEVCEDGLNLTVRMTDYLPGPGGGSAASTDVTDDFDITGQPSSGDREFTLKLSPKDKAAFNPKKYYIVQFRTCVTGDEIPDNSDTFTNTAGVNATTVTAEVKGPKFNGAKNGEFHLEPVEINGQEQPAGTTMSWNLEVPGHNLEGLSDRAVITDTFSDTMTVCEAGASIKDNLNLSVTAKDFRGDGTVHAERDLTEDTEVVQTDDGLEFTLPKEAGDYDREWRYFIDYTLCTSSGGLDARGTKYSNSAAWEGNSTNSSVSQRSGGGGTGSGVARGSFSLLKDVHYASEEFPEDTVFTVRVEEFAPGVDLVTGSPEEDYEIEVKADGSPVSGFNSRGTGWQIRLSEINLPNTGGVYFEQGKFRPAEGVTLTDGATKAIIAIEPRTNVAVELVNRAHHGTATVTKTVTGNATGELTGNEKFVIQAHISTGDDSGTELREFTLRDGQSYDLGNLPIGTEVTFTEVKPADTDRVTWSEPIFEPETLTIGADTTANRVSVTNEARITEGTFEISKKLQGPEANNSAVPDGFIVNATWSDADGTERQEQLTLPSDGTAVKFPFELPGGTEVTLTEVVPDDGNGLTWGVPSYSGDITLTGENSAMVTIGQDTGKVKVRNVVDTNDGTLRLTKQVGGEAATAAEGAEFTVRAEWRNGNEFQNKELTVIEGESISLGESLPVGTQVTFTEIGLPEIDGVTWGTPSWGTDPSGQSWLTTDANGVATGIVTDDEAEGALITLTNEAQWTLGSVGFQKFLFDGEDPVPATESDLPDGTDFRVRIDGIAPALPANADFPAVGNTITLNSDNGWSWHSGDVLPTGTVITFSEVDPAPLDGTDWARPFFYVAADAGDPEDRNTVEIGAGEHAEVEIRNRPIPTTDVVIEKFVSGPMGEEVTADRSSTFEVTATWTDPDHEERSCILDVRPNGAMSATEDCDAVVVGDRVQFPLDTEITFVETDAETSVSNISWGDVSWTVADGSADIDEIEGEPAGVVVTLTGDTGDAVTLALENEATLTEGTFEISKKLGGPEKYNAAVPASFDVIATWTDADGNPQEETLAVPSDGTAVEFPFALPGGTVVTLTEVLPENGSGLAWGVPSFSGDVTISAAGSATVAIDQEDIKIKIRNYVDTNDGTLRLTKQVSGEAAEATEGAEYTVEARWREGTGYESEELTVREGESTPLGHDLPVGTEVTFTEVGLPEIAGVEWGDTTWGTDPSGDSWLITNTDGTATGVVSDDPNEGRLVTLTNEALWKFGSVGFEKFISGGEDSVPASEAGLPDDAEFQVQIDGIDPAMPADTDFPAVGETITLNAANGWSWQSEEVLPKDTVVTFSEVDPAPLDGTDWARPSYHVAVDAGEPGDRNTVQIVPGAHAEAEVHNRPIPTTDVEIDKIVTGPKGQQVTDHESTTFQITASWTDVDDDERSCILDVTPDGSMTPTVECDAVVIGKRVQFPVNTEITFAETGAHTDVKNIKWEDVTWTAPNGDADIAEVDGEPTGVVVTLTDGEAPVILKLENETSSNGLIFIPIPIPLPPFDGGSSTPPGPGDPSTPGSADPKDPEKPAKPQKPSKSGNLDQPSKPQKPSKPSSTTGHDGAPGKPAPTKPGKPGSLAVTGANVAWLGGAALALIAGGAWLTLRNRREITEE